MYDNIFSNLPISRALDWANNPVKNHRLSEGLVRKSDSQIETFVYELRQLIGREASPFSMTIGAHPEFMDLPEGQSRKSPITSVFIDIKGSTQLYDKYSYEDAFLMQNALIQSAIYVIQAFDGHIVRIQGDGIFAIFGRAGASKENTLLDAINSSSTLLLLIESYLTEKFKNNGLEPLKIRVGIDHDDNAHWQHNGISGANELSPSGLHVSLASKLQNRASVNTIMIGQNVKNTLELPSELLSIKTVINNGQEKQRLYIRNQYRMWEFNWRTLARSFPWVKQSNGRLLPSTLANTKLNLKAAVVSSHGQLQKMYSSSMEVLNKGQVLKFSIGPQPKGTSIRWYVENRGTEAEADDRRHEYDVLNYEITESRNKMSTERDTAYHGHHYLICKVTYPSGKTCERRVGVFIGANWSETQLQPQSIQQADRPRRMSDLLAQPLIPQMG